MAVIYPLKVTLVNVADNFEKDVTVYPFPKDKTRGQPYNIKLSKEFYIEESDFRFALFWSN